ncbi:hypothetical protein SAMN04488595_10196 [Ralstonia sp. 25mfcol4.1]|nr:hypothetical protein SAMN04488595_10196 [Ralstonia sp. 25mfcol4.1]
MREPAGLYRLPYPAAAALTVDPDIDAFDAAIQRVIRETT